MKTELKKLAVVLMVLVLPCFSPSAKAITVDWSAVGYWYLTLPGGTVGAPVGGLLQIGVLTTNEATVIAAKNQPVVVQSYFRTFATAYIGEGTDNVAGSFTKNSYAYGVGWYGLQIYLLAFDTPTAETATYIGLYTNPTRWFFPPNELFSEQIDLEEEGLQILIGDSSEGTILEPEEIRGWNAVHLHQIPEPSTFVLVGAGLLGLAGLWRRRVA